MRINPDRISPILAGLAILVLTVLVLLLLGTFERTPFVRIFRAIWLVGGVASASLSFYQAFGHHRGPLFDVKEGDEEEDEPDS